MRGGLAGEGEGEGAHEVEGEGRGVKTLGLSVKSLLEVD